MIARYFIEYDAWWICRDVALTCERLYGPFNTNELRLAVDIHGIEVK